MTTTKKNITDAEVAAGFSVGPSGIEIARHIQERTVWTLVMPHSIAGRLILLALSQELYSFGSLVDDEMIVSIFERTNENLQKLGVVLREIAPFGPAPSDEHDIIFLASSVEEQERLTNRISLWVFGQIQMTESTPSRVH